MRRELVASSLVLAVVMSLVAIPSAQAARPKRTVFEATGFTIPAGLGCSFPVAIAPADGPITSVVTEFSSGRVIQTIRDGYILMTNVDSGESTVHHSQYMFMDTYDARSNLIKSVSEGTWWINFFPGDVGPFGDIVREPGLFLSMTGHAELTWNPKTFAITSFEFDGRINADLCTVLSDGVSV